MAELRPVRVLLVNAGGPGAPGTIRSLRTQKERDLTILGIDMNPNSASRPLLDKFFVAPATHDDSFLPFLKNLCEEEKIDVILPLSSVGLELFRTWNEDELSAKVVIGSEFSFEHSLNKRKLFEFLQEAGLGEHVPEYRSASTPEEFRTALKELGFPERELCMKPEEGKGGRGFRILSAGPALFTDHLSAKEGSASIDATTLFSHAKTPSEFSPVLVMEYLSGREYSVDVIAKDGEPLIAVPRTREAVQSGIASAGVIEDNPAVRKAAMDIAKELKGEYLLNIQFRYSTDGKPKLLEVNPRISGTIAHATCAGVNLPYLAVKQALGEDLDLPEPVWGTRLARGFFEAYATPDGTWHLL